MASIRSRSDSGLLLFDFRYQGIRCREQTTLEDTKPNRTRMEKILNKIEEDIASGSFVYSRYFPESKIANKFGEAHMSKKTVVQQIQTMHSSSSQA